MIAQIDALAADSPCAGEVAGVRLLVWILSGEPKLCHR